MQAVKAAGASEIIKCTLFALPAAHMLLAALLFTRLARAVCFGSTAIKTTIKKAAKTCQRCCVPSAQRRSKSFCGN
jgi:hypothetical protein